VSLTTREGWQATRERASTLRATAVRILLGGQPGLVVFLGTLVFAGLSWRVGVFITDTYTLANAFASLSEGGFAVEGAVYGDSLETPGMGVRDGRYYGRNYGQLVVSLPALWLLEASALVADPGLVFAAGWSLLVVALGREAGRLVERPALGTSAGAVCGLVGFLGNAAVARPLADRMLALAAMQLTALVVTALAAATLYRLLARIHGDRIGLVAAAVMVVATPVGFWASVPKRHAFTIALVLSVWYAFYRSRSQSTAETGSALSPLGFRALAYGLVGLATWLHAGEAFGLFVALVVVDLPTAPSNDRRSLAVVAAVFALSLVPFLLTNAAVSGDPLRPPRMLEGFSEVGTSGEFDSGGSSSSSAGAGGLVKSLTELALPPALVGPIHTGLDRWSVLMSPFFRGTLRVVENPEAVYRTVVRGGYIPGTAPENNYETTDLTVLEAGPLVAAVVAIGVSTLRRGVRGFRTGRPSSASVRAALDRWRTSSGTATDVLVLLTAVSVFLLYIQKLPTHAQVTARYLLVFYPAAVYGIVRSWPLRRALTGYGRTALWAWSGGVLLGAQLFVVVVAAGSLGLGEAFQVHALAGLSVALVLALFAATGPFTDSFDRLTALFAGLAGALGTDFLLLSGLVYFQYGQYVLPAVGEFARLLPSV